MQLPPLRKESREDNSWSWCSRLLMGRNLQIAPSTGNISSSHSTPSRTGEVGVRSLAEVHVCGHLPPSHPYPCCSYLDRSWCSYSRTKILRGDKSAPTGGYDQLRHCCMNPSVFRMISDPSVSRYPRHILRVGHGPRVCRADVTRY